MSGICDSRDLRMQLQATLPLPFDGLKEKNSKGMKDEVAEARSQLWYDLQACAVFVHLRV